MSTIGDHIENAQMWIDVGIVTEGKADKVLQGRNLKAGLRLHKITWQAAWRLIMPHGLYEGLSSRYVWRPLSISDRFRHCNASAYACWYICVLWCNVSTSDDEKSGQKLGNNRPTYEYIDGTVRVNNNSKCTLVYPKRMCKIIENVYQLGGHFEFIC